MLVVYVFRKIWRRFAAIIGTASLMVLLALATWSSCSSSDDAAPPYPVSTVVESLTFDFNTIEQHGAGSDQWIMTWADDDRIYAGWGDGFGWKETGTKMFMGVTAIPGNPPGLTGQDVWGTSSKNWKPGGFIADSNQTMYLFAGTADDGWDGDYGAVSTDNGVTWTFGSQKVFSFVDDGARVVGIAQFGPGYTNIPSGVDGSYFYVYFSGRTDARQGTDGQDVYLGRVPKGDIFNRPAYQYYDGLDVGGNPIWSSSWNNKVPVFHDDAGMGFHANVSYNPGLGRFIYAQAHSVSDLGIFEGPTPWGPWGTIYYEQFRDSARKFTYQFPQKWMSNDGKTLWMAWSGHPEYDKVSFIKTTAQIR